MEPNESLLEKGNKLMIKLSGLKHAVELRKKTDSRPVERQQTRWSSTFAMLSRYQELKHHLDPTDLQTASFLHNATENIVLANLITEMKKLKLEEENVDLSTTRTLFDGIVSDFADNNLKHYLGNDGICSYSSFEAAIVAVIECKTLSTEIENALEVFKKPILLIEQNDDKSYAESLLDVKRRKPMSHYEDLKWIPPTSNLAERLFSRVKYE